MIATIPLICGCVGLAPSPRDMGDLNLPSRYALYSENPDAGDGSRLFPSRRPPGDTQNHGVDARAWWRQFKNDELNALMEKSLGTSFNIREAWARLEKAQALYGKQRSGLFPALEGQGKYSGVDNDNTGGSESFSLGLGASYEVDLWGRVGAQVRSDRLDMDASRADLEAAANTVTASLAEQWIDLIAARKEADLVQRQIEINKSLETLLELRFEKSMSTALDLLQQQIALQQSQGLLPEILARETLLLNSMALLAGLPPGTNMGVEAREFPSMPPLPPRGIPADLLSLRPDVRAAGLRLKSADWEVAAARADRLPALAITAGVSYDGASASTLFDNWIANLAGNLTGPIFNAGKKSAEVDRARAQARERLATYEKVVMTAIREVEENMVNETMQGQTLALLEREIDTSRRLFAEAERHYARGLESYLPVVSALMRTQELEITRVRRRAALLKYRVGLYRSLGGGWTQTLIKEDRPQTMDDQKSKTPQN